MMVCGGECVKTITREGSLGVKEETEKRGVFEQAQVAQGTPTGAGEGGSRCYSPMSSSDSNPHGNCCGETNLSRQRRCAHGVCNRGVKLILTVVLRKLSQVLTCGEESYQMLQNCYGSQYGSLFGSMFSVTDGSGIFVSSLALTIIVSAIAVVGIVLVAVIITLAVMLASCGDNSTVTFHTDRHVDLCSSYRLNAELNNVQGWLPPAACNKNIFEYVHEGQYIEDIEVAVNSARRYLKNLALEGDSSYAVVVDVDETALSNALFYQIGRSEDFVDQIWGMWMSRTKIGPLFPVLDLYRDLRAANWSIFFVSERPESALESTAQNLRESGYEGWSGLLLRSEDDAGLTVQAYKSNKRSELETQGYRILTVLGDQWSDLVGPATGNRTFKLPNPMYHIS